MVDIIKMQKIIYHKAKFLPLFIILYILVSLDHLSLPLF